MDKRREILLDLIELLYGALATVGSECVEGDAIREALEELMSPLASGDRVKIRSDKHKVNNEQAT